MSRNTDASPELCPLLMNTGKSLPTMSRNTSVFPELAQLPMNTGVTIDYFAKEYAIGNLRAQLIGHTEGFYLGKWKEGQYAIRSDDYVSFFTNHEITKMPAVHAMKVLSEKENRSVALKRIIRANAQSVQGYLFYLTMEGTDNKFYEAEVYADLDNSFTIKVLRPAVHYPQVDPEILRRFDAPPDDTDTDTAPLED